MEVKSRVLKVGTWDTRISTCSLKLSKAAKEEALELINDYVMQFPEEDVLVQNKFKVPSLIMSMNCTVENGLNVYSISQNPKNLGIAVKVNSNLQAALNKVKSSWPVTKALSNAQFPDDNLWIDVLSPEEVKKLSGSQPDLVLIRDSLSSPSHEYLKTRSATSLLNRNQNSYGEKMHLWNKVNFGEVSKLPWEKGFALKPLAKVRPSFNIYYPRKYKGLISETKAEELVSNRSFYVQRFIPPMKSVIEGEKMIYKIYFGFDTYQKDYVYLGGMWLSRDNYRIHGTPETTFGKLI